MALSGSESYIPTLSEFRAYWEAVDGVAGTPLLITDPQNPTGPRLGVAVMGTLYDALIADAGEVSDGEAEVALMQSRLAEARRESAGAAADAKQDIASATGRTSAEAGKCRVRLAFMLV